MTFAAPLKLYCQVMHYPWGKRGADSLIFNLAAANQRDFKLPMAEFWIGTHTNAPATVKLGEQLSPLDELIKNHPSEMLGNDVYEQFGPQMPFLLKVLSIAEPLSIQAHPNKQQAEELHRSDPANYPDANHKPEIAIAISRVEMLLGFKPLDNLISSFRQVPELRELVEYSLLEQLYLLKGNPLRARPVVERVYLDLVSSNSETIAVCSQKLFNRLKTKGQLSPQEVWILSLENRYGRGDIGLFHFFLLNLVTLQPGEAVFVAPKTVHAYLSGDLVECMANSDNVVRVGLTNKFRDVRSLASIVDYHLGYNNAVSIRRDYSSPDLGTYQAPVAEFLVHALCCSEARVEIPRSECFELLFSLDTKAMVTSFLWSIELKPGEAYFVPATAMHHGYAIEPTDGRLFRIEVPLNY
ncbi:MAG: mannose-6-phosphate isomerase, class I [Deltaproteobacteria bacterium]|nr:mannose-6-phosphate isomerase, class I [Deltaproteobacteria bacterium]